MHIDGALLHTPHSFLYDKSVKSVRYDEWKRPNSKDIRNHGMSPFTARVD